MAILNFTLSPEALSKLHDVLICLGKFSEYVSMEASHHKLVLSALNSSKSAYASFTLLGNKFFSKYQYQPMHSGDQARDKFTCKIYNKALLSVFRGKFIDPTRERDTAVDRCDVSIEDGERNATSRLVVKIICRHGVLKTYKLTFESVAPMHALFVRESANNTWAISTRTLRELMEHFGPGTEQLDICLEDGRVNLTSYTEKIMSGNEILKQPLHTTIAIDTLEFGEISVEEKLHIVISVKDFKSIIAHASITNTMVKALYSRPTSPMQLTYSDECIETEFILMTIGETRSASITPMPGVSRVNSIRPTPRQHHETKSGSKRGSIVEMLPPQSRTSTSNARELHDRKIARASPPPPQPSIQSQALFFSEADDDKRWDPQSLGEDEDEMLLWDQGTEAESKALTKGPRLHGLAAKSVNMSLDSSNDGEGDGQSIIIPTQRLAPTQRVAEVKGIFD